jgi:hypothetical protein
MEPRVIQPEVGRHVHYVPAEHGDGLRAGEPHAAVVCCVWETRMVNLTVFDRNGGTVAKTSVPLQQPDDPVPAGSYCRWMPYTVLKQGG